MFTTLEIMRMANALATHSGSRVGVIAENIANADTPGFRARDLPDFETTWADSEGKGMRATRPGHIGTLPTVQVAAPIQRDGPGAPNGNTVSLQDEMVRAAQSRQDHDMALAIYKNAADILRAALGRR